MHVRTVLGAFVVVISIAHPSSAGATPATTPALVLLEEPAAGIEPIYEELDLARTSIDLEIYELEDVRTEQLLVAAQRRGVDVRVILNKTYTGSSNESAYAYLKDHGVAVRWAPSYNDITHEKAIVIDRRTALIMTLNLTAQYYADTRDVVVVDNQPRDVQAITGTFDDDWNATQTVPSSGLDLLWSPGSGQRLITLINSARHSLDIENEEMADPTITDALAAAARRHVDVTIVMTMNSEWKSAFNALANAGAHIYLYPDTASALYIHAKVCVADDKIAFVGSENFSDTSLDYNRELGLITTDLPIVHSLSAMVVADARSPSTITW